MEKLSRMQQRVYDYIAESIAEHGYAPSVREVGEALGLKSQIGRAHVLNSSHPK